MLALKRNAVIGLNLYCGGGPTLPPSPPGSPSGAGTPPSPGARDPGPPAEGVRPATLIGGASWGSNGSSEGARALIGSAAAAPALGAGGPRPGPLWRPEEELDGCDPEAERMGPPAAAARADGSLPSTPPAEDDDDEALDGLYQDSLELISRYLREAAELGAPGGKQLFKRLLSGPRGAGPAALEKALETLRRVGDGVMEKHQLAFQGMLRKLDIKNEEDLKSVTAVATHVFSDGVTNWGRIVTLISFGAFVAKHLKSINQENCINTLAGIITDVLVTGKRDWLVNQRGWEGFVEFFRVEDLEGSIRNVLVAFAGFAGLGASLAYMMR